MFARDAVLHTLPLEEALSRAFLHIKDNHFHILLLAAVVQASAIAWTASSSYNAAKVRHFALEFWEVGFPTCYPL